MYIVIKYNRLEKLAKDNYYMTSDNVFSDWLTSLVTFFDKTLYSTCKKSREVNIIFQRFSRHLKIEMVFPNYFKSSSQSSSGYVLSSTNQMRSY